MASSDSDGKNMATAPPTATKTFYHDDFNYGVNVAQAEKSIRLAFLRKVYGIVCTQLLLTTATCALFMFVPTLKAFIQTSHAIVFICMALTIVTLVALMMKQREAPTNMYLLMAFTFFEAVTLANVVLEAFFLTLAITTALTAFTFQSKYDFSAWGAGLISILWMLIVAGFLQLFFKSEAADMVLAIGGALLFCAFIIFDTQLILKRLSPEDYIIAAINLYLDIINLFIELLRILNHLSNRG
ncbi:Protein lifeguard 4 [Trichoplax sp. H2]|nr:Protein lifeguard 4 [Trichoplax sp. H2]|eukprot:RDD42829.1 Protein lifeguard 4 [Trichoplax sp. H2]